MASAGTRRTAAEAAVPGAGSTSQYTPTAFTYANERDDGSWRSFLADRDHHKFHCGDSGRAAYPEASPYRSARLRRLPVAVTAHRLNSPARQGCPHQGARTAQPARCRTVMNSPRERS
jgi:hypothetical protein